MVIAQDDDEKRNAEVARVQADVLRLNQAMAKQDVAAVLELSHPKVIELLGGMTKARAKLKADFDSFAKSGLTLERVDFPKSPIFVEGKQHQFVLVPTRSHTASKRQRSEYINFHLGVREKGKMDWKYIDGSHLDQKSVGDFVSDFPANVEFPVVSRKLLPTK